MLFPVLLSFRGSGGSARRAHDHAAHGMGLAAASLDETPGRARAHARDAGGDGAIALIVYEKLGLAILRRAWLNLT